MLSILVLFGMVVVIAMLNLKRRQVGKGGVLPQYDPIPEINVGIRDLKREAYIQANYFLTPRQRAFIKQKEIFPRQPFQVQSHA